MQLGIYQSDVVSKTDLEEIEKSFNEIQSKLSPELKQTFEMIIIEDNNFNDLNIIICFSDSDVLDAFRIQRNTEIPVLSVELPGDNSFFSTLTLNQLQWGLLQLSQNRFEYDPRIRMLIDKKYLALNDILISPKAIGQRMRYDILLDNKSLYQTPDTANQLLISTPTGSTALNLNLGGSIALPGTNVFQILSVASPNRGITSQIIQDSSVIKVEIIESEANVIFNYDNKNGVSIDGDVVRIEKAKPAAIFIKFYDPTESFHHQQRKLKEKQSFEDSKSLTSTAKFVLHVLRTTNSKLSTSEIISQTYITNRKTLSNALNLLLEKGFIRKHHDLTDARKFTYSYISE